jgi:hypothetical protein
MQSTDYSCRILMKLEFFWQILKKYPDFIFHENLSRGSQDAPHGRRGRGRDMTQLIVAFCNFVNTPENHCL